MFNKTDAEDEYRFIEFSITSVVLKVVTYFLYR